MKYFVAMTSALLMAGLTASPAVGQQYDRQGRSGDERRTRSQRERRGGESTRQQAQPGTAAGQVLKVKRVAVRDTGKEHLVVLVKTQGGKAAIVDLGPVARLQDVDIATGDTIRASGQVVAVGDRKVLMARVVRTGDRTREIRRSRSPQQGQRQHQTAFRGRQQGKDVTGTGQIIRTKKVNVRGRGVEHMVVLLKTPGGKRRVVDLGPVKGLKNVRINSGEQITVTGDVVAVGNSQVLMADRLQDDGRTVQIDRGPARQSSS